jgi:hypothetical protein
MFVNTLQTGENNYNSNNNNNIVGHHEETVERMQGSVMPIAR